MRHQIRIKPGDTVELTYNPDPPPLPYVHYAEAAPGMVTKAIELAAPRAEKSSNCCGIKPVGHLHPCSRPKFHAGCHVAHTAGSGAAIAWWSEESSS